MAGRKKKNAERKITEKDISGLKDFHKLNGLLSQLHDVGCERDTAGNRTLPHGSVLHAVVLLYLFKPIVERLGEQLKPLAVDKRLKDVKELTLVDGSILEALPRIAMASFPSAQTGSGNKMKWTQTYTSHVRNNLLVLLQHGGRRRTAAAYQPASKTQGLNRGTLRCVVCRKSC